MSQFPGFEEIEIKVSTEELLSQLAPKQANAEKYSFQAKSGTVDLIGTFFA